MNDQEKLNKLIEAAQAVLSAYSVISLAYGHLWCRTEQGNDLDDAMDELSEVLDEY